MQMDVANNISAESETVTNSENENSNNQPRNFSSETTQTDEQSHVKSMTTHEYAEAYRGWMYQQQIIHQINMAYFNFFYMLNMFNQTAWLLNNKPLSISESQNEVATSQRELHSPPVTSHARGTNLDRNSRRNGRQCEIPPLWKRFVAEMIDFFILFILKLAGSIILFDYIDMIDIEPQDLQKFLSLNWDASLASTITSELIVFELINRLFVSFFEAICLRRGPNGMIGGFTPGKKMMGLRVVSCTEVVKLDNKKVLVYPAGNLNLIDSLIRSLVKNFCFIFFTPMPLTALMFLHSRTVYDLITNSMVVYVGDDDARHFRR